MLEPNPQWLGGFNDIPGVTNVPLREIFKSTEPSDLEAAQRRLMVAQALHQRAMQPNIPVSSGPVQAAYTPAHALVDLATNLTSAYGVKKADQAYARAKDAKSAALAGALENYQSSTPDAQVGSEALKRIREAPDGQLFNPVTSRTEAGNALMKEVGPEAQSQLAMALLQANMAKKGEAYTLSPGQTRYDESNRQIAAAPNAEKLTDDEREYDRAARGGYKGTFFDYIQSKKNPPVNVTVSTGEDLYKTMAKEQGARNVSLYEQATKAPELLQRAQRVKAALGPNSQAITGAGAEQLLQISKVAAQLGFNTGDAAADTEGLARDLAASTLDQIKSSGLGAGSGFSNADRDFLEKVVGGKITLEAATLRRLADLNEKGALGTIQRWNATAKRLQPEQMKALGMSSIEMPADTPAPAAAPKLQRNPDGSYTYSP